ncbi:probable serine/threonine-protein kinase MARK-A [Stomoxys calcitrans]|uniref:probable serine/threonine-protein kinase MARK-A n=1 Tax=Stomoxys calcitrans TaxID=35570 RepID=UPI0027E34A45|nr:probable serine/threonine-protein kinase MARK-A [Stomoxys calcitrans]
MANTVFKYHQQQQPHHHHQQQYQQQQQLQPHYHPHHQQPQQHNHNYPHHGHGSSGSSIATIDGNNHNQNNSNQNSIFVLNAETKISPNSCRKFYLDFNDNPMDSCAAAATLTQQSVINGNYSSIAAAAATSTTSSSVWSSASSTMCSPAAHAIQKLFNCSSGGSGGGGGGGGNSSTSKHHHSAGIDSKSSFKTSKSELLKKKSKFWQYLEGETLSSSSPTGYEGIESSANSSSNSNSNSQKEKGKSRKHKSKYWPKSKADDNQNSHNDLSELLEYSCSLCDNCRCMDCQIGYFDCDNSDDSNSEYSFHMNAYEEDDDIESGMELKATITTATATKTSAPISSTLPSTPPSSPSSIPGEGDDGLLADEELPMQNSLGCNKMDNKNTIQQLEFENSTRRNQGNHAMAKHDVVECCHQCCGLEVEHQQQQQQQPYCPDFQHSQLYAVECSDRGAAGGGVGAGYDGDVH